MVFLLSKDVACVADRRRGKPGRLAVLLAYLAELAGVKLNCWRIILPDNGLPSRLGIVSYGADQV
jgi:hypothetical protein